MEDEFIKMRELMKLIETDASIIVEFTEEDEPEQNSQRFFDNNVVEDLKSLVSKLNNHYEAEDSEQSMGIEMGFQRAAEMIENIIKKYESIEGTNGQEI